VLKAAEVMSEGRVRVAVLPTRVVGSDRHRCLRERELAVLVADPARRSADPGAVNRVRAGYRARGAGGRVAAGRAGQIRLVLAVLEATEVVGEGRVRVPGFAGGVLGCDDQRCLRQRQLAGLVREVVVAGGGAA